MEKSNVNNVSASMYMKFKSVHSFDERQTESNRIRLKYPERVPVVCEKSAHSSGLPDLDKNKYLVPCDLTVGQFMFVLRKRIKLPAEQAIFLFVNGTIPSTSTIIDKLYDLHKDKDGFLYVTYSGENTFGH